MTPRARRGWISTAVAVGAFVVAALTLARQHGAAPVHPTTATMTTVTAPAVPVPALPAPAVPPAAAELAGTPSVPVATSSASPTATTTVSAKARRKPAAHAPAKAEPCKVVDYIDEHGIKRFKSNCS